jgi:hypothetical protein
MKMERKNINDYLSKSNLELLTDFKWGIQGQNDFGQFMNLVRKLKRLKYSKRKLKV